MDEPRPLRFVMIGATGYVAPKHRAAIKHVGGQLVAIHNRGQNVGFLNSEFPECRYFENPWRFLRELGKLQMRGEAPDYAVIATPNWLHDPMAVTMMKYGMNVIVEKPTCVQPKNLEFLRQAEAHEGRRIWTTLQTVCHPAIRALRETVRTGFHQVELSWATDRQDWYYFTWKNTESQSGGLIYNIGVHFLHVLGELFGPGREVVVRQRDDRNVIGSIRFERAHATFDLSVDPGRPRQRLMIVDSQPVDFTDGFDDLHNVVYDEIIAGDGIGLDRVQPAIVLAHAIQTAPTLPGRDLA